VVQLKPNSIETASARSKISKRNSIPKSNSGIKKQQAALDGDVQGGKSHLVFPIQDGGRKVTSAPGRVSRPKAVSIPVKSMLPGVNRLKRKGEYKLVKEYPRPTNRVQCRAQGRPCVYVGCKYNLYLDVNPQTGTIKMNFPDIEPHEMGHSCALDIADKGGSTLEFVSQAVNMTRERTRQYEFQCCEKMEQSECAQDAYEALINFDIMEMGRSSADGPYQVNRGKTNPN
jgi:hypothetical protein